MIARPDPHAKATNGGAPFGQVLALGNQTLIHRAGQQGDAVLTDLMAEVLAGDAK